LLAIVAAPAGARQPILMLKPGLWEVTATTTMGAGRPAVERTAPAAGHAKDGDAMRAVMDPRIDQWEICLTREQLERGEVPVTRIEDGCERTVIRSTRRFLEMSVECTGDPSSEGIVTIEALTPASLRAAVHTTLTLDERSVSLRVSMTARWLGDCQAPGGA
jgi:hypothetical protein